MGIEVSREEVERLAYQLWIERGRPEGSPQDDWDRAERLLQFTRGEATAVTETPSAVKSLAVAATPTLPLEVVSGAPYSRPKQRNGGSRKAVRA